MRRRQAGPAGAEDPPAPRSASLGGALQSGAAGGAAWGTLMRRAAFFGAAAVLAVAACARGVAKGPYDPVLDGLAQLQAAAKGHERILAIVGGNW